MAKAAAWPTDAPDWLRTYSIEHLECRVMGHSWDAHGSLNSKVTDSLLEGEHYTCTSCKGERFDVFDTKNRVLWARKYDMPEEYPIPEGEYQEPKSTYLLAWHHRMDTQKQFVDIDDRFENVALRAAARWRAQNR